MPKKDDAESGAKTDGIEEAGNAELNTTTLVQDMRNAILDIIKTRPKPWSAMPEEEQQDVAAAVEHAVINLVEDAVELIRSDGNQSVRGLLKSYTDKGELTATITINKGVLDENPELITMLHQAVGKVVVITNASAETYSSNLEDAETDPDEPKFDDMDVEDEEKDAE